MIVHYSQFTILKSYLKKKKKFLEPKTHMLYNKLAIALFIVLQGDNTWDHKPNPYLIFLRIRL